MLDSIAPEVWAAEHDVYMGGVVHFRARMVVVRLPGERLLLWSPIPIEEGLAGELARLGRVAYVVAPNRVHHLYLPGAMARYPEAEVWGAPGLVEKRSDIRFHATLDRAEEASWSPEIAVAGLRGAPSLDEYVFLHRPSKTLVVTDLVFNIHEAGNFVSRLLFRAMGAYRKLSQSRLWRMATKDRAAMHESIERVLAWDFERVVPAHGRIVEEDAKARLTVALAWMLRGARRRLAAA